MGFKISGQYVTTCGCRLICPCSVDGVPTGPKDQCTGAGVFHIAKGDVDGLDVSGINVGMLYFAPSNFSSGGLKMGIVVDEKASDTQVKSLEQVFTGQIGGPFAEFAPAVAEFSLKRDKVTYTAGKKPTGTIGKSAINFEPIVNQEGVETTIVNAPMAFRAAGYTIGKGSGRVEAHGFNYDAVYGEAAAFDFAS